MNKEQIARIVQGAVDAAIFDMADTTHEAADAVWALLQQEPTVEFKEAESGAGWFEFGERSGLLRPGMFAAVYLDDPLDAALRSVKEGRVGKMTLRTEEQG